MEISEFWINSKHIYKYRLYNFVLIFLAEHQQIKFRKILMSQTSINTKIDTRPSIHDTIHKKVFPIDHHSLEPALQTIKNGSISTLKLPQIRHYSHTHFLGWFLYLLDTVSVFRLAKKILFDTVSVFRLAKTFSYLIQCQCSDRLKKILFDTVSVSRLAKQIPEFECKGFKAIRPVISNLMKTLKDIVHKIINKSLQF